MNKILLGGIFILLVCIIGLFMMNRPIPDSSESSHAISEQIVNSNPRIDLTQHNIQGVKERYLAQCKADHEKCSQLLWSDFAELWDVDPQTAEQWFKDINDHELKLRSFTIDTSDMSERYRLLWSKHEEAFGIDKAKKIYGLKYKRFELDRKTNDLWNNPKITNADERVAEWESLQTQILGDVNPHFKKYLDPYDLYKTEIALREKERPLTEIEEKAVRTKYFNDPNYDLYN